MRGFSRACGGRSVRRGRLLVDGGRVRPPLASFVGPSPGVVQPRQRFGRSHRAFVFVAEGGLRDAMRFEQRDPGVSASQDHEKENHEFRIISLSPSLPPLYPWRNRMVVPAVEGGIVRLPCSGGATANCFTQKERLLPRSTPDGRCRLARVDQTNRRHINPTPTIRNSAAPSAHGLPGARRQVTTAPVSRST